MEKSTASLTIDVRESQILQGLEEKDGTVEQMQGHLEAR